MKRTTIVLSSALRSRAERAAKARGMTFSALVRAGLEKVLGEPSDALTTLPPPLPLEPGENLPRDLSANMDDYLYGPVSASSSTRARSSRSTTPQTTTTKPSRRSGKS